MKIALIDPALFTWPYDRELAGALMEIGHEAAIFGRALEATDPRLHDRILKPVFYSALARPAFANLPQSVGRIAKGLSHFGSMRSLHRVLSDWEPDVIHFQWLPLPIIDQRLLPAFRELAPLVLTVHDTLPFNGTPGSRLQNIGAYRIWRAFDHLIVHTEQGRERLEAQGVAPARISQIPHGLLHSSDVKPSTDAPRSTADGVVTLLMFGKLKPYKGVDVMIRALAQLNDNARRKCRVRVVGKPYMETAPLIALARELGVSEMIDFEFRYIPDEELGGLLDSAGVLLFPYREIEASGVLMAAIAHGRPLIASRLGAFAELVEDGRQGFLVKPEDVDGLARAIERVVLEPGLLGDLTRGMETLRDEIPSWRDISRRTVNTYETALRSRSRQQIQAAATVSLKQPSSSVGH